MPASIIHIIYYTNFGQNMLIGASDEKICMCGWPFSVETSRILSRLTANRPITVSDVNSSPILSEATRQLDAYFGGSLRQFDLPLLLNGTDFQTTVWENLIKIPYGQTISYSELAERCGNPKAVRAVANSCRANPIVIIVPCHRVIGANGSLTGYAGGLELKKHLIEFEKSSEIS